MLTIKTAAEEGEAAKAVISWPFREFRRADVVGLVSIIGDLGRNLGLLPNGRCRVRAAVRRRGCCLTGRERVDVAVAVEQFGSRVEAVWPADGAGLAVDPGESEVIGVAQRFAERSVEEEGAVDVAGGAVVEGHPQPAGVKHFDLGDADHGTDARGAGRSARARRALGHVSS